MQSYNQVYINHTTEQRKSRNFWSIRSPLLCACAVRFARVLALAFLARSLTHSGSHYASPIVHSLAPSLRPSLTGAKKIIFFKVVPRPLGMLKRVFLCRFEPVVARFGPWKIPKCLEDGPFWDQRWVKNGWKTRFSKNDPGPFMMLKQVVLAHFEPVATGFGSWKIRKCLENGLFWDQKWSKMGQKRIFPKVIPDHLGCSNKCFWPVLSPF